MEGAAAITVDSDEGVLLGALGLIGSLKSELKAVHLKAGPKKIGLLEDQSQFEKLDRGGIACTFEIGLDADIIEQLGETELSKGTCECQ